MRVFSSSSLCAFFLPFPLPQLLQQFVEIVFVYAIRMKSQMLHTIYEVQCHQMNTTSVKSARNLAPNSNNSNKIIWAQCNEQSAYNTHNEFELMYINKPCSIFIEHLIFAFANSIRLPISMYIPYNVVRHYARYTIHSVVLYVLVHCLCLAHLLREDCVASSLLPFFLAISASLSYCFALQFISSGCVVWLFLVIVLSFLGARIRPFTEHELVCIYARVNTIWWICSVHKRRPQNQCEYVDASQILVLTPVYWRLLCNSQCIASCAFAVARKKT